MTNTVVLREEIDTLLNQHVSYVRRRTRCNLNDSAINSEGFFRNFLNRLYYFNLSKERIESAYNETIDLHDIEKKICVQITARNERSKVKVTVDDFESKRKYLQYSQLHFVIIDNQRKFSYPENKLQHYGVSIVFHDCTTIFKRLVDEFDSYDKIEGIYDFVKKELDPNFRFERETKLAESFRPALIDGDSNIHIIDRILNSLKTFKGFECIYPRTVSRLPVFNSKESYYDSYSHFCLKTSNEQIHELLQKVKVYNSTLTINDDSLLPYSDKLKEVFSILNRSLIRCVCYREKYTEIEHYNINITPFNLEYKTLIDRFYRFDVKPVFSLLKSKAITHSEDLNKALGEGYYLCKVGEHVKGCQVFNSIAQKSKGVNPIIYFLALYNLKKIRPFVDSPWWEDESKPLLPEIDAIDLHNTLSDLSLPLQVRDELIKVKENYFFDYSRETIDEQFESISDTYQLYKRGGFGSGTPAVNLIQEEMFLLHSFYSDNYIVKDDYHHFREAVTKGVEGLLISFKTDENYRNKYDKFDSFILILMVFYLEEKKLELLFTKYEITIFPIESCSKESFITTVVNFFDFQCTKGFGNHSRYNEDILKQDYFSYYRQSLRHFFNKIMLILSKVDLSIEELKPLAQPLLDYLKVAEDFNHNNWEFFLKFFKRRTLVFSDKQIETIIEYKFNEQHHRPDDFIFEGICKAASEKASFVLTNTNLFQRLLSTTDVPCNQCKKVHSKVQLIAYWDIADEDGKRSIKEKAVQYLQQNFDPDFYRRAVFKKMFVKNEYPELLQSFILSIENSCSSYDIKQEKSRWQVQDFTGYNGINILAYMQADFTRDDIQAISKKSTYYNWLINPETYDYSDFDVKWLTQLCPYYIRPRLTHIHNLRLKVKDELQKEYDQALGEFFINYLS